MYSGSQDIRQNVKGRFRKYYMKVTINRTKGTENFKCFENNKKESHTYIDFIYARNDNDAFQLTQIWSKHYSDKSWNYKLILHKDIISLPMDINEVIEDFHRSKGFNYLINYSDSTSFEVIH